MCSVDRNLPLSGWRRRGLLYNTESRTEKMDWAVFLMARTLFLSFLLIHEYMLATPIFSTMDVICIRP
jgi:hypothetical protein